MPHLQFEVNKPLKDKEKEDFIEFVKNTLPQL